MSRLIIYAGRNFTADFTVISDDGLTGQVLDPTDTATFSISSAGSTVACIIEPVPMEILDADNGLFVVSLTAEQTALLTQEVGGMEDNYSPLSNYTAYLDFYLVSGSRQAHCDVYVKEVGTCETVA